jgi:hypothetical protein
MQVNNLDEKAQSFSAYIAICCGFFLFIHFGNDHHLGYLAALEPMN